MDIDELLEEETLEEEMIPPVAHDLKPAGHMRAIERIPVERILNVPAASSRPAPSRAPVSTPALDREIMDRLKREKASS